MFFLEFIHIYSQLHTFMTMLVGQDIALWAVGLQDIVGLHLHRSAAGVPCCLHFHFGGFIGATRIRWSIGYGFHNFAVRGPSCADCQDAKDEQGEDAARRCHAVPVIAQL